MTYRKLSIALTDLLAEAQTLVNLRSEFGRLPNSPVKAAALERIDEWFQAEGADPLAAKPKLNPSNESPCAVLPQGTEHLVLTGDMPAMADIVPCDDGIPF